MTEHPLVQQYIAAVCAEVRCREVHGEIRQELLCHLEDLADRLLAEGTPADRVAAEALAHMGDPAVVGRELNRAHRPRTDWSVIALVGLLVAIGAVALLSVEQSNWWGEGARPGFWLVHLALTAVGLGAALGLVWLDYRLVRQYWWAPFAVAAALLVSLGPRPYDGSLWQLAIYESTPLLFAVAAAGAFARLNWTRPWAWPWAFSLWVVPSYLFFAASSARYFPLYSAVWLVLVLASRPKWPHLAGFLSLWTGMGLVGLLTMKAHHKQRLMIYLNPARDADGAGYMATQSKLALQNAGLWGHGWAAPLDLVPNAHSDLLFTYMTYAFGWAAGAAFCLLFGFFLFRLGRMTLLVREPIGHMLALALLTLLAFQFIWSVLMASGITPILGLRLPFTGYGPQVVAHLAALGLMLGVYRRKDMLPAHNGLTH